MWSFNFQPANIFDMKNIGVATPTLEDWCNAADWCQDIEV